MSSTASSSTFQPKALLTDVFGTIVNWRLSVISHLRTQSFAALNSQRNFPPDVARQARDPDTWSEFAQAWRVAYYKFCKKFVPGNEQFKTIDLFMRESLETLLRERGLAELWTSAELDEIARIWHCLEPWPDSKEGLRMLKDEGGYVTATLSNGNRALLRDLVEFGGLAYSEVVSAEDFGAYKPHPRVYRGAAESLGMQVEQCALIAAHLGDLQAAKKIGMGTVYVEREEEEAWSREEVEEARREGWVDLWVGMGKGGVEEVARRLVRVEK